MDSFLFFSFLFLFFSWSRFGWDTVLSNIPRATAPIRLAGMPLLTYTFLTPPPLFPSPLALALLLSWQKGEVIFYPHDDQHKFEFSLSEIKRYLSACSFVVQEYHEKHQQQHPPKPCNSLMIMSGILQLAQREETQVLPHCLPGAS